MTEKQYKLAISLFKNLHSQQPKCTKDYYNKLILLNKIQVYNNIVKWTDITDILSEDESISVFNALNKTEGYSVFRLDEKRNWVFNDSKQNIGTQINLMGTYKLNESHPILV